MPSVFIMRFYSFIREGYSFHSVEVQLNLLPGLPEVKFSGLADMSIRESATRLKSAFQANGFKWPGRQQIVINLSPASIRKTSAGMDLALALALLWKTGQMDFACFNDSRIYAYGEVGLNGEVTAPDDWDLLPFNENPLLVGPVGKTNYRNNLYVGTSLKDFHEASLCEVSDWKTRLKKPDMPEMVFSEKASLILKLTALGEHSLLLCGEAGSGKTTLVENLYYLLKAPEKSLWEESRPFWREEGLSWRPCLSPHHTTTPQSMIGGGGSLFSGEISKAHGGQLIMDEYLEFHPKVQEALREPLEKGQIRLVRNGKIAVFPAKFLLTATTNLCPCGDYVPGRSVSCSYSLKKCQSHLDRLSGPMLDRFDLLGFSHEWKGRGTMSLEKILHQVEEARDFILRNRSQKIVNGRLELRELEENVKDREETMPCTPSQRRKRALLRVARTFADLDRSEVVKGIHLERAYTLAVKNFYFLKNRMMGSLDYTSSF